MDDFLRSGLRSGSGRSGRLTVRERMRTRAPIHLARLLLAIVVATGCESRAPQSSQAAGSGYLRVSDAEGRSVELEAPARRIVSLVPSVTRTIVALGATYRLVARTDFDTAAALVHLPSVGGGLGPNLEVLATLDPDLVIRFAGASDRNTPDRLDALGVPNFAVKPDRIADVWQILDDIGTLLDLSREGERLRDSLQAGLAEVGRQATTLSPTRVAYLMGGSPPWTAGAGTYIGELIELAGGINVFSDLEGLYGAVSPEVVATREIDVVLLAEGAQIDPRLLAGRRVRTVSSQVQLPGPELVDAAREVAAAIAGGAP